MTNSLSTRRLFLRDASLAVAGISTFPNLIFGEAADMPNVKLTVGGGSAGPLVPRDFVGLSYESMQLEDPSFFSPANISLVQQFRAISPRGVLRLGGNTSEFGWWKAKATDPAPKRVDSPWKAGGEPTAATLFAITPEAIDNLSGFLHATGWNCIYGLNLGYGTPETDIPEATYVFNKLGPHLEYFQVGNEVDLFKGHLRDPQTWNVDRYLTEWLVITQAVQKALPEAKFGMPDVAGDVSWLAKIADRWSAITDKPHVSSLSHHHYWGGPPSNPDVNIENLLKPDGRVGSNARTAREAAEKLGPEVSWRMTEGNTVYRGGKDGVSDVFAAALWSADYLLQLMTLGYAGVNLHGGSGHAQAVSVGGVFHGEALMKDPTAPHPKPFYTPIANEGTLAGAGVNGKLNGTYVLEPVAYGMKFAAAFAGATMIPVSFDPGRVNAVAYAAKRPDGKTMVAVLNKDASTPIKVIAPNADLIATLMAPALDSREAHLETVQHGIASRSIGGDGSFTVPAHTGMLLVLR
jgi:hypothetical protein